MDTIKKHGTQQDQSPSISLALRSSNRVNPAGGQVDTGTDHTARLHTA
jgi:hypothetical protein